jgi:hypothetical protein
MHFYLVIPELAASKCMAFGNGATSGIQMMKRLDSRLRGNDTIPRLGAAHENRNRP